MTGKIIGDTACPQCREGGGDKEGNHLMIFEDGGGYCNRCEYTQPREVEVEDDDMTDINTLQAGDIPSRGLREKYVSLYGGKIEYDTATREQVAVWWPRNKGGKVVGQKVAGIKDKTFKSIGDGKDSDLFGMEVEGGNKLCIITEGELDAVSTKQMLADKGKNYTVVSLPNGATSRLSGPSHEFLMSFDTVIMAVDMDDAGDKAAAMLSELLEQGKCKRAMLPAKDANDCLMGGLTDQFFSALMSARTIMADGVVLGSDTWDAVLKDHHNDNSGGIPFPWEDLNKLAYGSRIGEVDVWTSGTGMGKSAIMRELIHHWSITHNQKVGVLALEENLTTTMLGQMSICANLPLHLPEVKASVSDEDLRGYWEQANANDNLVCVDHWGSVEQSRLISKIRYLASGMGCKYVEIDHLSILVSEVATDGDERKNIDVLMTKLKRLTEELQIHISIVSHLNRSQSSTTFEEGATPTLANLRGSGSIAQLAHGVYALTRNQQDPDPILRNMSKVTVLKNRFCGKTGDAGLLNYNTETGRLETSTLTLEDYRNGHSSSALDQTL